MAKKGEASEREYRLPAFRMTRIDEEIRNGSYPNASTLAKALATSNVVAKKKRNFWRVNRRGFPEAGCRPCRTCAMLIINCGISRVVCEKHYHDESDSLEMFRQAGIKIEHLEDGMQTYKDM